MLMSRIEESTPLELETTEKEAIAYSKMGKPYLNSGKGTNLTGEGNNP